RQELEDVRFETVILDQSVHPGTLNCDIGGSVRSKFYFGCCAVFIERLPVLPHHDLDGLLSSRSHHQIDAARRVWKQNFAVRWGALKIFSGRIPVALNKKEFFLWFTKKTVSRRPVFEKPVPFANAPPPVAQVKLWSRTEANSIRNIGF